MARFARLVAYAITPIIAVFLGYLAGFAAAVIFDALVGVYCGQPGCIALSLATFYVPLVLVAVGLTWLGWWLIRRTR
jgi:hypothetical protein